MTTALDQIRQQYPQYAKVPDRQLADALYAKFYAGKIDKPAYYAQLGMTTEDRENWSPLESINNVVNQLGTGAYKGIAGLVGLPGTLSEMGVAMDLPRKYGGKGGMPNPDAPTENQSPFPSGGDIETFMQGTLGIPFAPRETTGDKYLQAAGTGASAVVFPGSAAANLTGGVVGSVAGEGAGQLTEGTKYEPAARLVASLLGGTAGVAGANRAVASSVEDILSRATMGYTADDWAAAMRLQSEAAARGTPITAPEALAQVKGGNRQLMGLQRYAEQSPDSERAMGQFMAGRTAGSQGATEAELGSIAQRPDAPFEVGPSVQAAAQKSINDTRQRINDVTRDPYRWGTDAMIPPAEFAPISESPIFQHYVAKVRNDPLFGAMVREQPDNSIAIVNQVKKLMDEDAANFSTYGTGQTSPERAMRLEQAQGPMVDAAKRASPLYEGALEQQATMRRSQLDPMKRGATGQVAETGDWQRQAQIMLSDAPGAEKEVANVVRNIMVADPERGATNVATLLRMKLEDAWNKALPTMKGNAGEFRGANFASVLERNPQAMKSLEAAITALPGGAEKWQGFRTLLRVYEAQGQRMPAGSPTEFNRQMTEGFQRGITGDLKSLGRDLLNRWNVRRRTGDLARVFADPEGVAMLRQLARLGPDSRASSQLVQAYFQGSQNEGGALNTLGLPSPAGHAR
jgi:hypothetical protein